MKKHVVISECNCVEHNKFNKTNFKVSHSKITKIFYHHFNFYAITFNSCIANYNDYEVFELWITQIVERSKNLTINKMPLRSNLVDDYLERIRKNEIFIKENIIEYNFFYDRYAIISKVAFMELFINNQLLEENYKKAIDYIEVNGFDRKHKEELTYLFKMNMMPDSSNIEIVKTTDFMIETIKKTIKKTNK